MTRVLDAVYAWAECIYKQKSLTVNNVIDMVHNGKMSVHTKAAPPTMHAKHTFTLGTPFTNASLKYVFLCLTSLPRIEGIHIFNGDMCICVRRRSKMPDARVFSHVFTAHDVEAIMSLCHNNRTTAITVFHESKKISGGIPESEIESIKGRELQDKGEMFDMNASTVFPNRQNI